VTAPSVEEFREAAAAWLSENEATAPPDWGAIMPPERRDEGMAWQKRLYDAGFAAIHWPESVGGRGLTPDHTSAWMEQAAIASVPPVLNMVGLVLAAGALLAYGTPDQQQAHLPPTAWGERVWCQLFSEPGAGSDLASLSTRAIADGDEFLVNGQKVWTSGARASDWGILLARTLSLEEAPKHKGISFFVVDMHTPGIETRPLRQMTGGAEFDEVFMTDVRLPASALIGPLHGGWGVAMATLTNERGHVGAATVALDRRIDALVHVAKGASSPVQRDRLMALVERGRALQALSRRQGPVASAASSLTKLGMSDLNVDFASARATMEGAEAMLAGSAAAASVVGAPGGRLGGGTSEIQRTIIGERILGLPAEPRP
jgi:alkylation response protein AidB-like acyl-CoA dehydrogenase